MLGLVLEGGGAKGAYQIGSYFALKELGFKFDAITGTSIGAINGAFIAMGEAHLALEVWRNSSLSDFYHVDTVPELNIEENSPNMFLHFKRLIENINIKRIPLDPLKNLVYQYIDEEKVRNSNIKFGLVTINLTDMIVEERFIDDIPKGQLCDYIIASCYLPIFKRELINGKVYLDGGFVNQIPFNMVQRLGMEPVIVRANPNDDKKIFPQDVIVIAPNEKFTSTMDFNPEKADLMIRTGYFDTYKKIKGYLGKKYYVKPFDEEIAHNLLKELYFDRANEIVSDAVFEKSQYRKFYEGFLPKLAQNLGLESNYSYCELLVTLFEYYGEKKKIENLKIYSFEELKEMLIDSLKTESLPKKTEVFSIKDLVNRVL